MDLPDKVYLLCQTDWAMYEGSHTEIIDLFYNLTNALSALQAQVDDNMSTPHEEYRCVELPNGTPKREFDRSESDGRYIYLRPMNIKDAKFPDYVDYIEQRG